MTAENRVYPFRFTGNGAEYFRIWIADLVWSLLTLGLYSAWAKTRRKRYFNRHILLDGHHFEYRGDPVALLKGRLPVLVLLPLAALAWSVSPWLSLMPLLAIALASPWLVAWSLRFHARNSLYRGLSFDFIGAPGEAARIYLGWGLATLLSLGLTLPYLLYRRAVFIGDHHACGATRFRFQGRAASYYGIFMKVSLILLAPLVVLLAAGITLASMEHGVAPGMAEVLAALGLSLLLLYATVPIAAGYINARVTRLMFLGTRFADLGFAGRHTARELIALYVSNLVFIVLSLGLFIPWARVRCARFWLDNLALIGPERALDRFVVASCMEIGAAAEQPDLHALELRPA